MSSSVSEQCFTLAELAEAGVKRVSFGAALSRAALGGFLRAACEIKHRGTFRFVEDAVPFAEANDYMEARSDLRPEDIPCAY
jgi:2-methylisocitrate lyase-like PEP mutase family enzyme